MLFFFQRLPGVLVIFVCALCVQIFSSPIAKAEPVQLTQSAKALNEFKKRVQLYTLSNGLRLLVIERDNIAPVFNGAVNVRVGGVDEQIGHTGISHMLEHMAFKGTEAIGTNDFGKEQKLLEELEVLANEEVRDGTLSEERRKEWERLQSELAKLWDATSYSMEIDRRGGVGLNATTSKELTRYFVSLPSNALEFWMWIESERLLRPVLRQFYKERDVVLEERRMNYEDDPSGKLYESLLASAFQVHPYRTPVIGYEKDVRSLTAKQTEEFHKKYYAPQRMLISVVGNVDGAEVKRLAEKYFGSQQPSDLKEGRFPVEPKQKGERIVNVEYDSSSRMALAYHVPTYPNEDVPALSVFMQLLNGTRLAPLHKRLVEEKKYAVSVSDFAAPGFMFPHIEIFWITPRAPHTPSVVLEEFDRTLSKSLKQGFSEEELRVAKRQIGVDFARNLRSNGSIGYLLAQSELLYGGWEVIFDWYKGVESVTADDVKRVANEYFVRANRTVAVIGRSEEHLS